MTKHIHYSLQMEAVAKVEKSCLIVALPIWSIFSDVWEIWTVLVCEIWTITLVIVNLLLLMKKNGQGYKLKAKV